MTETTVLYRVQCAVITHGCLAWLVLDGPVNIDLEHLDREVPEDRRVDSSPGKEIQDLRWLH